MINKRLFQLFLIITVSCLTSISFAADKYVRKGASGGGTSWSDAYGEFSNVSFSGLSGYTLWVAAGNYTSGLPYMNNIDNVTIKRGTTASHGTSTGWSNSYDGQVNIDPSGRFIDADGCDNFTLDGVSNNPWRFRIVGSSGQNGMILFESSTNVTFRNLDMDGNYEGSIDIGEDGFRFGSLTNLIVEFCDIHDYTYKGGYYHNDGVQMPSGTNATFRYNRFSNSGMHLFVGDCEWGNQYVNGLYIHHNVFYNPPERFSYNSLVLKGVNKSGSYTTKIENNTFAIRSSSYGTGSAVYNVPACTNSTNLQNYYFRNNILYDSSCGGCAQGSHSYNNYYNSGGTPSETGRVVSDPLFKNYSGYDFTLQENSPVKNAGVDLGYNADALGTPIPNNLQPTMGAYEFSTSAATTISPPKNLRVTN